MKIVFFTSISLRYLPNALILAKSVKRQYPAAHFSLLLSDWVEERDPIFDVFDDVLFSHELGIKNFKAFAFSYSVIELCTAVKGAAAMYYFREMNADYVVYLDPDTVLFSNLDEVFEDQGNSVFLTPHITDAEDTIEAIESHEIAALKHGTFNLGFFAIKNSRDGLRFGQWLADRLLRYSHIDFNRGLFTDQKWANLAPYIFDGVKVIINRSYNAATWNIKNRLIRCLNERWFVNEDELCFYHFSGFGNDFYWADLELERFGAGAVDLHRLWKWYKAEYAGALALMSVGLVSSANQWDYYEGTQQKIANASRREYDASEDKDVDIWRNPFLQIT